MFETKITVYHLIVTDGARWHMRLCGPPKWARTICIYDGSDEFTACAHCGLPALGHTFGITSMGQSKEWLVGDETANEYEMGHNVTGESLNDGVDERIGRLLQITDDPCGKLNWKFVAALKCSRWVCDKTVHENLNICAIWWSNLRLGGTRKQCIPCWNTACEIDLPLTQHTMASTKWACTTRYLRREDGKRKAKKNSNH